MMHVSSIRGKWHTAVVTSALLLVAFLILPDSAVAQSNLRLRSVPAGEYYVQLAKSPDANVLVIVHGTYTPPANARTAAKKFAQHWLNYGRQHNLTIVAPIFDDANYSSCRTSTGNWGYRGLLGKTYSADTFLHQVMDDLKDQRLVTREKFWLFGHSAGGQFASRYLVQHPDRILGAVVSSAKWYPFPDNKIMWPNGMKRRKRSERWPDGSRSTVFVQPSEELFLESTQLRVEVIVGEKDLEVFTDNQVKRFGSNRILRAQNWCREMSELAKRNSQESRIAFHLVPGSGHDPQKLSTFAQTQLDRMLERKMLEQASVTK